MASTFHALPLPSGESFLLKTDHEGCTKAILIDSGMRYSKGNHPLPKAILNAEPNLKRIDIAVCTHQDADHANGFRTFADVWCGEGKSIGEFWLPGRWAVALPDILLAPERLIEKLYSGALEVAHKECVEEQLTGVTFEERIRCVANNKKINQYFRDLVIQSKIDHKNISDPEQRIANSLGMSISNMKGLIGDLEETDSDSAEEILKIAQSRILYFYPCFSDESNFMLACVLLSRAIDTAKIIRDIALSSIRHSIPIRWFDFGLFESEKTVSGGNSFLEPVNSKELKRPPSGVDAVSLLFCLNLSRQNVESLVFIRPETENEPAVLFLGDSRLAFGVSKPRRSFPKPNSVPERPIIITAPHHGSQVNDHAYDVINKWFGSSIEHYYVRNGGHWKQKIYKYKNQKNRRCAQCVQCCGKGWNQLITLISNNNGNWEWPPSNCISCM